MTSTLSFKRLFALLAFFLALGFILLSAQAAYALESNEIIVKNENEMNSAITSAQYTKIYLGANIPRTRGIILPAAKPNLTISGTDPTTGIRYTLSDPTTTIERSGGMYLSSTMTSEQRQVVRTITLKDITVKGYSLYGTMSADDNVDNSTFVYENVTYTGPQLICARASKIIFKGNTTITTGAFAPSVLNEETAQVRAVEFASGKILIKNTSTATSAFFMNEISAAKIPPEFTIKNGVDVTFDLVTPLTRAYGLFYIAGSAPFPLTIGDNASVNFLLDKGIVPTPGIFLYQLSGMTIGQNSKVYVSSARRTGNEGVIALGGDLVVGKKSRLEINAAADGTIFNFAKAGSRLLINSPGSVVIKRSSAQSVLTDFFMRYYYGISGSDQFQSSSESVFMYNTYYDKSGRDKMPTASWGDGKTADDVTIKATINALGGISALTSNKAGLTSSTFVPNTARIMSFGPVSATINQPVSANATTITGTATPGATVYIDYKIGSFPVELTGVASANGTYSIKVPERANSSSIPSGTSISLAVNIDYRTKSYPNLVTSQDFGYVVAYYKDTVSAGNHLGTSSVKWGYLPGETVSLPDGIEDGSLDYKKPIGYLGGVQQGRPYVVTSSPTPGTINVLYADDPSVEDSIHGGYITSTTKCSVCHSAHRAVSSATQPNLFITRGSTSCASCHATWGGGASNVKIEWAKMQDGSSSGPHDSCTTCHSGGIHGAGSSEFHAMNVYMLGADKDKAIKEALETGKFSQGIAYNDPNPKSRGKGTDWFKHGTTNIPSDGSAPTGVTPSQFAAVKSMVTAQTCSNGSLCHSNVSFNGGTADATHRDHQMGFSGTMATPEPNCAPCHAGGLGGGYRSSEKSVNDQPRARTYGCDQCHDMIGVATNSTAWPHGDRSIEVYEWNSSGERVVATASKGNLWMYRGNISSVDKQVLLPTSSFSNFKKSGLASEKAFTVITDAAEKAKKGDYSDGVCLKCHIQLTGSFIGVAGRKHKAHVTAEGVFMPDTESNPSSNLIFLYR